MIRLLVSTICGQVHKIAQNKNGLTHREVNSNVEHYVLVVNFAKLRSFERSLELCIMHGPVIHQYCSSFIDWFDSV